MKSLLSIRGLLAVARRHRHAVAAAKPTYVPALLALLLFGGGRWFDGDEAPEMAPREAGFYRAQVEEFAAAAADAAAARSGGRVRLRLMDVTRMMLLRPDGHPDRYGHGAGEHDGFEIDCLNWCLPGAIDVWNELLLQTLEH